MVDQADNVVLEPLHRPEAYDAQSGVHLHVIGKYVLCTMSSTLLHEYVVVTRCLVVAEIQYSSLCLASSLYTRTEAKRWQLQAQSQA